jgi:Domain of unknown function (DUF4129)
VIRSRPIARVVLGLFCAFVPMTALAATPAAWPHDPNAIVRQVLAQPDYRSAPATTDRKPQRSLWDQFWDWVGKMFRNLFGPVARAVAAGSGAATAVGVVLALAAVLALVFVLVRLALALVAPGKSVPRSFIGKPLAQRRTFAEWRAAAAALAARGDYARAIAALFGAALAGLDERGLVPFDATRTPGEYRRLVRRTQAGAGPPFDDLTAGFVRAAYSGVPAVRVDFEDAERALAHLEVLVAAQ